MAHTDSKFHLVRAANVWSGDEGWELLTYYNIYRLGLALVLIALASPDFTEHTLGYESWTLIFTTIGFAVVSIVGFINIKRQSPEIHIQAHILFLMDLGFISILTFSHELHESNIIVFYITTVAATAVIFRTKTAMAYAVIATFVMYARDSLELLRGEISLDHFYVTALTAFTFFAIVLIVSRIAKRTRVVQGVLEQQELDLADLDDINQLVVDHLEVGLLFLDDRLNIKLINNYARELIGEYIVGSKITGKFAELLDQHITNSRSKNFNFHHKDKVLALNSVPLRSGMLIYIEDRTTLSRKIQKSKLSSVGRFASAISHEIRNPLNAINHAAQLIQPDKENLENNDLIEIIRSHTKRINNIVESILERSRPGKVQQKEIHIKTWLTDYIATFQQSIGDEQVALRYSGEPIDIYFDPTQLEQIITNLCQNSLKYARVPDQNLEITFQTGYDELAIPYLDIMNNGATIPDDQVDNLFEPFYTTDSRSTGLGLFLSREFCSLNGANIEYFNDPSKHGFRISFLLQDN